MLPILVIAGARPTCHQKLTRRPKADPNQLAARAGGGTEIREGMVLHLPMSLRRRGVFGVMQSETVVITNDGCEALSNVERRLFVK